MRKEEREKLIENLKYWARVDRFDYIADEIIARETAIQKQAYEQGRKDQLGDFFDWREECNKADKRLEDALEEIEKPLKEVENRYHHLKSLIKDCDDSQEGNMFHVTAKDFCKATDEALSIIEKRRGRNDN